MSNVSEFCRRRALERYPQLAQAVPPKYIGAAREHSLRPDSATQLFENYFWDTHQRDHVLRSANSPSLVIPIHARGNCLYPLKTDGDVLWFDPTLPAEHGDVVLFQHREASDELQLMAKMLVEFSGRYWLSFRSAMFPLGDIRILGVEVLNPMQAGVAQAVSANVF